MKKLVLSLLFIGITTFIYAQDTNDTFELKREFASKKIKWQKSFGKAQKLAKRKNKPLLVFFTGSDWCGPCKNLHKDFFETKKFKEITGKDIILYEADFPRRTDIITSEKREENKAIQRQYGVRGYPTIVILNSDGNELTRKVGYGFSRNPEPHFKFLKEAIELSK